MIDWRKSIRSIEFWLILCIILWGIYPAIYSIGKYHSNNEEKLELKFIELTDMRVLIKQEDVVANHIYDDDGEYFKTKLSKKKIDSFFAELIFYSPLGEERYIIEPIWYEECNGYKLPIFKLGSYSTYGINGELNIYFNGVRIYCGLLEFYPCKRIEFLNGEGKLYDRAWAWRLNGEITADAVINFDENWNVEKVTF